MNIKIPTNLSETAAAEIQAIIDRETKAKGEAFVPKFKQRYWRSCRWCDCLTHPHPAEWWGDAIDRLHFVAGNCHSTREAASAAASAYCAKFDAQYAIARWLAEHQEWLATEEERDRSCILKFYAQYHRTPKTIVVSNWRQLEPLSVTSFRTREYADQFIAECGEHLRVVHGLPKEEGK